MNMRRRHLVTLAVFFQGTRTATNDTSNNSRQLLICVFLRFALRLEQHGCERYVFGKSVSCFFGAETDNDERLVNRENHVLKQTEYYEDFSKYHSSKKTKVGIVWNITRICSKQETTQIIYSGNNPNKLS